MGNSNSTAKEKKPKKEKPEPKPLTFGKTVAAVLVGSFIIFLITMLVVGLVGYYVVFPQLKAAI